MIFLLTPPIFPLTPPAWQPPPLYSFGTQRRKKALVYFCSSARGELSPVATKGWEKLLSLFKITRLSSNTSDISINPSGLAATSPICLRHTEEEKVTLFFNRTQRRKFLTPQSPWVTVPYPYGQRSKNIPPYRGRKGYSNFLRRKMKLRPRYFSRTTGFSASSSDVPWKSILPSKRR